MLALGILLGIVLLVVLFGFLPVSVTAEYQAAGPSVVAKLGPFKIHLYPGKSDSESEEAAPEKRFEQKNKDNKHLKGGRLGPFKELLELLLQAQKDLRNRLCVRELTLYLTVGGKGDDPASAGILTGSAWMALGGLIPLLESSFQIKERDIQVGVDFLSEETLLYAKATAAMSLGAGIRFMGYYGLQGLKWYRKHKQKGGKEYGTSDR